MIRTLKSFFRSIGLVSKQENLLNKLTEEERRIYDFILTDLTYKEIGEQLFKSKKTISAHARNIFQKAGCNSRKEFQKKFEGKNQYKNREY